MKNRKISLSVVISSYYITLQISNVKTDPVTGAVIDASAWTQFIDSAKSLSEYKNPAWTLDSWVGASDAVKKVDEMIDIIKTVDDGASTPEDALKLLVKAHDEWLKLHLQMHPNYVEKQIAGLNCIVSKSDLCKNVMQFFSEVPDFQIGSRFLNTLALSIQNGGRSGACDYVSGYFKLQGNSDAANSIVAKMGATGGESPEWDTIENGLANMKLSNRINRRLKIYFGAPGTHKTTMAMSELEDQSNIIVCNSSIDSNDLMFDFDFKDGKPVLKPSKLFIAAQQGKTFVLDEINLLNDSVLFFLQGITDNKSEFSIKGYPLKVKEGFNIIGTMNLIRSGRTYGLPSALVDRCYEIKECVLDASMLESALD